MTLRRIHLELATVFLGVTLLVSTSATTEEKSSYDAIAVGEYLPKVMITGERSTRDLLSSSKTLVHFWASYDAESRAENLAYAEYFSSKKQAGLNYQAISLDNDAEVYKQTLAFDRVESNGLQLRVDNDLRKELMALCKLKEGFHSFVLDDRGKVLAVDPDSEMLDKFVEHE